MITRREKYIKYTAFMYETPYTLPAIDYAKINGNVYSKKKEVNDEENTITYTFCLAQSGRDETEPQHKVVVSLCPSDKNELFLYLTSPKFILPIEQTDARLPHLWFPEHNDFWQAKKYLLQLHNEARDNYGDGSDLIYDMVVDRAAQSHAEYMALNDDYQHTTKKGVTLNMRLEQAGYKPDVSFIFAGENIAVVPYTGNLNHDVAVLFMGWKESQDHWENLLNSQWAYVGFGIAIDITINVVYGVANFIYGGTRERIETQEQLNYFNNFLGYDVNYELDYRSDEIDSNHTLADVTIKDTYKLEFNYKTPELPSLGFLGFYKNYQNALVHPIHSYTAYEKNDIGESKRDALQLAYKDYTYTVLDWDSFSSYAPGGYFFCAFSLDNYKGDYPAMSFLYTLDLIVYIGSFLELFGLTGGRIIDKKIDAYYNYVYDIANCNQVLENVKSSDNIEYNVGDYVILSKTSKSFEANDGFSFVGQGRDNSPDRFRGSNFYTAFANKPVSYLDSDKVNSIDSNRDDYYIIPVDPTELPE